MDEAERPKSASQCGFDSHPGHVREREETIMAKDKDWAAKGRERAAKREAKAAARKAHEPRRARDRAKRGSDPNKVTKADLDLL
jgi:hypothetical protein